MSSINKNSFFLTLSNTLNALVSLFLSIALARLFDDKRLFGEFFQLFLIINFALALTSGIPLGLNYFFGKYKNFSSRYFLLRRLFYFIIAISVLVGFLVFFGSEFIAKKFDNQLFTKLIYYFIGLLVFKLINSFFANFSLLSKNIKYYSAITSIIFLIIIFFLGTCFLMNLSLDQVLIGLMTIEIIRFLLMSLKIPKYLVINPTSGTLFKKKETLYIGAITGVTLLNTANIYLDKYMISFLMDSKAYAEYQVGSFTIPFIFIISGSIITAMIPEFSRLYNNGQTSKMVELWKGATKEITFLLLPIFVFCIFFGKDIIVSFYGIDYKYSGFLFQIYSLRFIGSVVLFSLTMGAIGLQNWVFINSMIGLVLNFILNYFLITQYGVLGAIVATILSTYIGYLICISLLKLKAKIAFKDYFPLRFYVLVLFVSIVVAMPLRAISFINYNIFVILAKALVFYMIVLLLSNKFSKHPIPIIAKLKAKLLN